MSYAIVGFGDIGQALAHAFTLESSRPVRVLQRMETNPKNTFAKFCDLLSLLPLREAAWQIFAHI